MLTIDPMQDALNPDGYPLIEADAKLLFLKGGHYCFQYRDAGKETYNPHSARNGREKRIKKQVQG